MPTVAIVDGAKIQFFAQEHPPPHFHIAFAEYRAQIEIDSLRVLKGNMPTAKLRDVISWAETRQAALMQAWICTVEERRRPEKIV